MATIKSFEEIEAWQSGRELTDIIYTLTSEGEFSRDYSLKEQIRRAATSVTSNIAEGFESRTNGIFIDLLGRARGSAGEIRSQLYVALDRGYISQQDFDTTYRLARKVGGQISCFISYLGRSKQGSKVTSRA
jgi:four helix bundle protein